MERISDSTSLANDYLFVCDKFGSLCDARISLKGETPDFEFKLHTLVRPEERKYLSANFHRGSYMNTVVADNLLTFPANHKEIGQRFQRRVLIIETLSLLMPSHFIVDGIVDRWQFVHDQGSYNQSLDLHEEDIEGIVLGVDVLLPSENVLNFWDNFSGLKVDDRSRLRSSIHLFWRARASYARGYINEAVTDAISALENLYMRPGENGYIESPDVRVLKDDVAISSGKVQKWKAFRSVFTANESHDEAVGIVNEKNPYHEMRSKYLHAGAIEIGRPQDHPEAGRLIEIIRERILESLILYR